MTLLSVDPDCIGKEDKFYVVNDQCLSYYECAQGIKTTRTCESGRYFNTVTERCELNVPSTCQRE